jgi:hypothetical protein
MTKGFYFLPRPAPNPGREGEELPIPPESYVRAQALVDDGWEQGSRKYRMVRKGKKEQELSREDFAAFRELHPDCVSWSKLHEKFPRLPVDDVVKKD